MGVLQAGHQLGLGLEAADEPRPIGQVGTDHFHRHLPPELGLLRPVDPPKGALPDELPQAVVPQPALGHPQVGVVAQDPVVELLQLGRGLHPQLLDKHAPGAIEGSQRLGLAAGSVGRHHELAPEALP